MKGEAARPESELAVKRGSCKQIYKKTKREREGERAGATNVHTYFVGGFGEPNVELPLRRELGVDGFGKVQAPGAGFGRVGGHHH